MKDSLKKLLNKYPYFFNKSSTSNFFKSQNVTNERFRDVYQSIFEVVESFHLSKRCLIWKDQSEAYNYTMNFIVNYPNLKSVKIYKNDELIYIESYNYEDSISSFIYAHEDTTLDANENGEIIPTDTYKLSAETYDEIILEKGFPENDTILNDIYDHDVSLDEFGAFLNVPRKEYVLVSDELLSATEPPYNNRLSEDDYHYMNRMLNYALLYHTTPLPVLELWKLWSITATMENREKYLLKMFDETLYDYDEETGLVGDWTPKPWEHKDKFCQNDIDLGEYFFVRASTNVPARNSNVILNWVFMNNLAEPLSNNYLVDIYQDDTLIFENLTGSSQKLKYSLFTENVNKFKVVGKTSDGEIIGTETVTIMVRGCATANWYVSPTGDDNNDGKSIDTPFQTIQKAVSKVRGDWNLISILNGSYTITSPVKLHDSCNIMGCTLASIENTVNNKFFEIPAGKTLTLNDLELIHDSDNYVIENMHISNNNDVVSTFVTLPDVPAPVPVPTTLTVISDKDIMVAGETANITATVLDENDNPLSGETVTIEVRKQSDDSLVETLSVTDEDDGTYTASYLGNCVGNLYIKADCMLLSEIYSVSCSYQYDMLSDSQINDWNVPSTVSSSSIYGFSSDGWRFGNASSFSTIPLNFEVAYPFVIEYELVSRQGLAPHQLLMNSNNHYIGWQYDNGDIYKFLNNGGGMSTSSVTGTLTSGVIRMEVTATNFRLLVDDVEITSRPHTLNDNGLKFCYQTGNNRENTIKNFKIQPL